MADTAIKDGSALSSITGTEKIPASNGSNQKVTMTAAQIAALANNDHGSLTGLSDDDHSQYHNDTRGDARYYTQSQITAFLAGKADSAHTHTASEVSDFDTEVANNATVTAHTTKLAGIEDGATADQSAAEIKTAYESNTDTNAFTDAEKSKLVAIESSATADQTGAEIEALLDAELGSTDWKQPLTTEQVQDIVGALFQAGTHTNVTVTYDDVNNKIDLTVSGGGGGLDQEQAEDIVANLIAVTGGGINVSYDDVAGTLTFSLTGESFTTAEKNKLAGIAVGATANDTDANLKDRANHTGTQLASTISDFATAVSGNSAVAANTAKTSNATHTGEVTGDTTLTIAANAVTSEKILNAAVTNAKLANMANSTIKGRATAGSGAPEDLTATQVRTILNVTDGADNTQNTKHLSTQTLTDGATINWDTNSGAIASVTLGGNRTLAAPTNLSKGAYVLIIKQDGTGNRTLTFDAAYVFPDNDKDGTADVVSLFTGANKVTVMSFIYDGTTLRLHSYEYYNA